MDRRVKVSPGMISKSQQSILGGKEANEGRWREMRPFGRITGASTVWGAHLGPVRLLMPPLTRTFGTSFSMDTMIPMVNPAHMQE